MNEKQIKELAKELGRRGGNTCLKKHGKKFYSELAQKRWSKRVVDNSLDK